ncbi:MAG TPA: tetratricopeptide repeat protein [Anaerolineae bacterium]|nr:tetratricopeptide repeat protein [Anaerolineae bacterium]
MYRLVSPFILEKYAVGEVSGDLAAAALFVDISGFSAITDTLMNHGQHGAEVMANLMRQIFTPLVEAVYVHNGFISTFAGDAFTALFSINEASETGVQIAGQRALAAGWIIFKAIADQSLYETPYAQFDVGVKVGLAIGDVHWQIIRAEEGARATFYFRGSAIERAVHAEEQAGRNMMILSPEIHQLFPNKIKTMSYNGYQQLVDVEANLPQSEPINLPPVDKTILRHFFPSTIVNNRQVDEFRQVVNLYIGLQGEPTNVQMIQFGQTLLALQAQYGGLFNRIDFGDKGYNVVLFWGAPVAYENDVSRAFNLILDLQEQSPILIRAGVTFQMAHTGVVGSDIQGEFACTGNGVNLAARLMMQASWGEIWLDTSLAEKGRQGFEISEIGTYQVKGFAEPQKIYLLGGRKNRIANFYMYEMVGREVEMAQVQAFIESILDSDREKRFAGILAIMGEAGLGKSRLVNRIQLTMEAKSGVQFAFCQTDQTHRSAFNPFIYWLRNYFNQSSTQSVTRNKRVFNRKLDQLLAVTVDEGLTKMLSRGREALGSLVALSWENSTYEQLPPKGRYEWRLTALKALLLAESQQTPLVVVLEDAHWLDVESINFIERLGYNIDAYPLAILVTSRPMVGDKPLLGKADYAILDLAIMEPGDIQQLLNQVLGGNLAKSVAELIISRAEGNPFFGEQIALYLQEKKAIVQQDGKWHLVNSGEGYYLPQDIRTIFTARLDQLAVELKEIVQTAAILGREFEVQVLSGMLQEGEKLLTQMATIEAETIWVALSQVRYLFKHALLRDAAYEMQVRSRRSQLHQLAAITMEQLYINDLAPYYEAIAKHYVAAYRQGLTEVGAEALQYLGWTVEQFSKNYEHRRVITTVNQALAILEDGVMGARGINVKYDLLLWQEGSYDALAQRIEQAEVLRQLLIVAMAEPAWQVVVLLRQIAMLDTTEDVYQAMKQIKIALALTQEIGDVGQEAAVEVAWGRIAWRQAHYEEAQIHSERGVELAQISNRLNVVARGLRQLGLVANDRREYNEAADYFKQSLVISEQIGYKVEMAINLNNLGDMAREQGMYEVAVDYLEHSLMILEGIGYRFLASAVLHNLGVLANMQEIYEKAREYHARSLMITEEIGEEVGVAIDLTHLGDAMISLERVEEAIVHLTRAVRIWQSLESDSLHEQVQIESLAILGWGYLQAGDRVKALELMAKVESYLAEGGSVGRIDSGWRIAWLCYQVLAVTGDVRAEGRLMVTYEGLMADANKIKDEGIRESFLKKVPWHREIVVAYETWNQDEEGERFSGD